MTVSREGWEGKDSSSWSKLSHPKNTRSATTVHSVQSLATPTARIDGYSIARRAYFLGRWIRHSGWYPGRVTRLFRRGKGTFSESRVHEQLRLDGTVAQTRHDLLHLTDPDLAHYMHKFNTYTTLAAQDMAAAGRKSGIADMTVRPAFQFFKMYVLRRGVLDGIEGFILAVLSSAYVFTKYAKLWELTRGQGQGRS